MKESRKRKSSDRLANEAKRFNNSDDEFDELMISHASEIEKKHLKEKNQAENTNATDTENEDFKLQEHQDEDAFNDSENEFSISMISHAAELENQYNEEKIHLTNMDVCNNTETGADVVELPRIDTQPSHEDLMRNDSEEIIEATPNKEEFKKFKCCGFNGYNYLF